MSNLPWGTSKVLTDEEFFNRTQEISNLTNLLNSTSENNAPDILVTGIRGVGKTVLLNKIKQFMDKNYLVVYMDFSVSQTYQKNKMSLKGLYDFYYQKIIEETHLKGLNTLKNHINKFFKTNNFKLKEVVVANAFDISIPIPIIGTERDLERYRDFVFKLPQEIYDNNKDKIGGVIIIIDEFQVIKELDTYLESFLWNFRGYVTEQRNVAYILSGSMGLQDNLISEIAGQNGAFGGRMLTININPFSKQTTQNYLAERAPELKFSQEGFERFYKCTSGIPYYINIFARQLPTNRELDENNVIDAFDNNISFIVSHLINEWNRLTTKEKDIIIALIDSPLKRIDLARKLNVKSGSLSDKLNKLQNLDLIRFAGGEYEISEKLLKRWLEIEYSQKGIYPYRF
ncbi:MAG: AAA family ATPase [Methanobrevibacter sp.]|uniref:AAA family ATPase n=1 Tax=Methanobrevibacter sp. TaxID=66852 RepID=UPI0025F7FBE3|nr:ATP-binding protein [Methanobrevibacter sp.]MBQ6100542.1 AAA family ATPase [Methanobrevibacter sp.]